MMRIGIDPGWTNLGLAVLDEQGKIVETVTINCSSFGSPAEAVSHIAGLLEKHKPFYSVGIERYVVYGKGKPVKDAEHIQHVIGCLMYYLHTLGVKPMMYRAIDWKTALCKHMFITTGYRNPSEKFDKKYSISIAAAVSGTKLKIDHEADAVGIAYLAALATTTLQEKKDVK